MGVLNDAARAALSAGRLAHLVTINRDGSPGPGVKFPPFDDPPPGRIIHIRPERIGGVGHRVDR